VGAGDRRHLAAADEKLGRAAFIHFDMRFGVAIDAPQGGQKARWTALAAVPVATR
jgi:hypothetical protein